MTFSEFGKVLVRYWFVVVLIPIVLGLGAAAYAMTTPVSYEAKSYVTASDPSDGMSAQNVASVIESVATELVQNEGLSNVSILKVENKIAAEMDTVAITVQGDSAEKCVQMANEIADQVVGDMKEYFALLREDFEEQKLTPEEAAPLLGEDGDSWDFRIMQDLLTSDTLFRYCTFVPTYAQGAEKIGSNPLKLVAAGVAGGLVIAICILACYAGIKRPLMNESARSSVLGLPILNFGEGPAGESALISIKLLGSGSLSQICLIPISGGYGDGIFAQMNAESDSSDFSVAICDPLDSNPGVALAASDSDGVVLCAKYWKDSSLKLQSTVERLKSYEINPLGVILVG